MTEEPNGRVLHVTALVKDRCARADWLTARGVPGRYVPYAETEIGTAVHSILSTQIREFGLDTDMAIDPATATSARDRALEHLFKGDDIDEEIVERITDTIIDMAQKGIQSIATVLEALDYYVVHDCAVEQNYKATVRRPTETVTISGTADLVLGYTDSEGRDHVAIVDWKSGSSKQLSHKLQLEAYRQLVPGADRMVLVYLGGDDPEVVVFTADDITKGRGKTKEVVSIDIHDLARNMAEAYDEYIHDDTPPPCSISYMCRYCRYNDVNCRGI